jgi:murein DD-endopeptidase MepM/ murein hydrolase activator NlpD
MRGTRIALILITATSISACIPRGAGDYRLGKPRDDADVSEPEPVNKGRVATGDPVSILPAGTPDWSPASVEHNARQVESARYLVRAGDTLYRIGNETGAGAEAIARANGLSAPFALRVGQSIEIPGGLYHRVALGETGIAIARAYRVGWTEVVSLNALEAPFVLRSGHYLRLPDVASHSGVGAPPASRPGSFTINIDDVLTGGQPALPEAGTAAPRGVAMPVSGPARFAGNFGWPLTGTVLSRFGSKGGGQVNDGVDIGASLGAPVNATTDGTVVYAGSEIGVYGGLVLIDHGGGWVSAYGHMGRLNVKRGDRVIRGQAIGGVGDTGYVESPQLHFELRKDRKPVDPLTLLPAR